MILAEFFLPFPPSVNQLYPTAGSRRVISSKYKAWIKEAISMLNKQIIPTITERCSIVYSLNHPDNRARDAENYPKAMTDLLVNRGTIQDDCRKYLKRTVAEWNDAPGNLVFVTIFREA